MTEFSTWAANVPDEYIVESHTSSINTGLWLVESWATFYMSCFAGQHVMTMLPSKHMAPVKT